ncbi:MAG: FAD-binding oxidoreductase [Bacteroidia bacterium]|nr:FAD-binding oxidoreductase [Bacteroidia bacterium]
MLSFWETKNFIRYDYCVIGAGITGLSAACELAERFPKARILVLERGLLPTGASTKNAGFACIGSLSEKVHDLQIMGEDKFLQLVENRWKGLQILRKRLSDHAIGFEPNGGYELVRKNEPANFLGEIDSMNKLLKGILPGPVFSLQNKMIAHFGLNLHTISHIIFNNAEGQIDTGKMMYSLWTYANLLKVKIITGANVEAMNQQQHGVELECNNAYQKTSFFASKVLVCTNAFTKQLLPQVIITPGRGQVIVTSPVKGLKLKGIFSFDEGYFYFRNFENRIIFGGGRNLDFEKENTMEFGSNRKIIDELKRHLKETILPGHDYTIDQQWSGIMAFSADKLPLVKRINEHLAIGVRLNGMGIALGSKLAKDLVDLIA